jgi:peptidoglycan/LPS O-acetylase OafA/YrhL
VEVPVLLSDAFRQGRHNNFNLIRLIAAWSVLVSHSWPLALGPQFGAGPSIGSYQLGLGARAVDVFFVASGFLVSASLWRSGHLREFFVARALRIYPALIVAVVGANTLGLVLTSLPWAEYVSHRETWRFLWKNAVAMFGAYDRLPGVFAANPFPNAVNGSLWTLGAEIRMYIILALLWFLAGAAGAHRRQAWGIAVVAAGVLTMGLHLAQMFSLAQLPKALLSISKYSFVAEFLLGAGFFILRRHVRLDGRWFAMAAAAVVAAAVGLPAAWANGVYLLALPYLVFYLAYVPAGAVRRFNSVGDYSYGIYIFAWPVQQTIALMVPGVSVLGMIAMASAGAFGLAWLSWRYVEAPALALKGASLPAKVTSEVPRNVALERAMGIEPTS